MIVLVPGNLLGELVVPAQEAAPEAELRPYREADVSVSGQEEGVAVLREPGGERFSRLVAEGPNVRWLHTACPPW